MTDIQNVKKELFQEFDKFNAFFSDKSGVPPENFREILALNRSMFQKLREVLLVGSEADKKEVMELFSRVMKTFGALSKQIVTSSGISSEMMKEIMAPFATGNKIVDPEHVKMVSRLGRDLENMVKQSL